MEEVLSNSLRVLPHPALVMFVEFDEQSTTSKTCVKFLGCLFVLARMIPVNRSEAQGGPSRYEVEANLTKNMPGFASRSRVLVNHSGYENVA